MLVGDAGKNPVISTRVDIRDGVWSIAHTLMNGQVISRGDQYRLASWQNPSARYAAVWQGQLMSNTSIYMQGGIWYDDAGVHYDEFIYDNANRNTIIMHSTTLCAPETVEAQAAPTPESTPAPEPTPAPKSTSTSEAPSTPFFWSVAEERFVYRLQLMDS
jgi:hypothetical protein